MNIRGIGFCTEKDPWHFSSNPPSNPLNEVDQADRTLHASVRARATSWRASRMNESERDALLGKVQLLERQLAQVRASTLARRMFLFAASLPKRRSR